MLTQDQYNVLTGQQTNYSVADWQLLEGIAEERLASFLCLEQFPVLDDTNEDLAFLLANFLSIMLKLRGTSDVIESKSVRNFTINFKQNATNAFRGIYSEYEDIIQKYSQCDLSIKVESSIRRCCGYRNNGYYNF